MALVVLIVSFVSYILCSPASFINQFPNFGHTRPHIKHSSIDGYLFPSTDNAYLCIRPPLSRLTLNNMHPLPLNIQPQSAQLASIYIRIPTHLDWNKTTNTKMYEPQIRPQSVKLNSVQRLAYKLFTTLFRRLLGPYPPLTARLFTIRIAILASPTACRRLTFCLRWRL